MLGWLLPSKERKKVNNVGKDIKKSESLYTVVSVQFSHSIVPDSFWCQTAACQASLSITNPGAYSNSLPSSRWCHPTISFSVVLCCYCFQSFPASGSFPMSCLFASGGQSVGVSSSASVLPMNIQNWLPLELTGLISLRSKGLSRVFSSITIQNHPFFGTQPSLWSSSHICTWVLEKL